jgi:hypothetical protein
VIGFPRCVENLSKNYYIQKKLKVMCMKEKRNNAEENSANRKWGMEQF